ncbi:MAG: hypothetical protein M3Q69_16785 [Acidobacteriota bacterium]|nr:hypothetical protein [Acidobacteriota bacterium]
MKSLITLFALSFIALHAHAAATKPFDTTADMTTASREYVGVDDLQNLKGVKRVAIPSFEVEFVVRSNASSKTIDSEGSARVQVFYNLRGAETELMQQIVDKLYADTVADLVASGIEVLPYSAVEAAPSYAKLQGKWLKPSPLEEKTMDGMSRFIAPAGMPLYFYVDDKRLNVKSQFGAAFNMAVRPQVIEKDLAKELDAAMLRVRIVVLFADMKANKGILGDYAKISAKVDTRLGLALLPKETQFTFITPTGRAAVELTRPILAPDPFITEVNDITTRGKKAAEAAGNALSVLAAFGGAGGVHTSKSRDYDAVTTPDVYRAVVDKNLTALRQMFMARVKPAL